MNVVPTELKEVLLITPDVHGDHRGFFMEMWRKELYAENGIPEEFVQDNLSLSRRGTLRGLHFQNPVPQGKLVSVIEGEVFDVAVDVRLGSPTFGKWVGVTLDGKTRTQMFVPPGFAHGFVVLSETALFHYKCTAAYRPDAERVVLWNDPALGIQWPISDPQLSARDAAAPPLAHVDSRYLDFPAES